MSSSHNRDKILSLSHRHSLHACWGLDLTWALECHGACGSMRPLTRVHYDCRFWVDLRSISMKILRWDCRYLPYEAISIMVDSVWKMCRLSLISFHIKWCLRFIYVDSFISFHTNLHIIMFNIIIWFGIFWIIMLINF